MFGYNYLKVALATPKIKLGNVEENVNTILQVAKQNPNVSIILFPELVLTGYALGDWFFNQELIKKTYQGIEKLISESNEQIWIIGGIYDDYGSLYNVAYLIQNKEIIGIVPKTYLPSNHEFYEPRLFTSGINIQNKGKKVHFLNKEIPFGNILFKCSQHNFSFGVEICGDLWVPNSPHEKLYLMGAEIVFNLSASTFYLNKDTERIHLCQAASIKGQGAYLYTSCGASQTSSDVIFSGHRIACVLNEMIVNENNISFENEISVVDIDLEMIRHARHSNNRVFNKNCSDMEIAYFELKEENQYQLEKTPNHLPFVPKTNAECQKIIDILAAAIYKRLNYIGINQVVIGISGGLDSTLALLITVECFKKYHIPLENIIGVTMPGFGTSKRTKSNAIKLMELLNVTIKEIDIINEVKNNYKIIGHNGIDKDTTYENVQARYRTLTLMNLANFHQAIVLGTSDMSEIALGWSTFNGDQMAMYNVNSGITKTTVKAIVKYFVSQNKQLEQLLIDIIETPISPELTDSKQSTEDAIGKYEINDFILYHIFVNGASKKRIIYLLQNVFNIDYDNALHYYNFFLKRFNQNQFKRLASPEGMKIYSLSLSPRGDFRYPGDME